VFDPGNSDSSYGLWKHYFNIKALFRNKSALDPVKTLWYFPASLDIKLHDEGLQVSSCNTFFLGLDSPDKDVKYRFTFLSQVAGTV
jgi:hypothetical protein